MKIVYALIINKLSENDKKLFFFDKLNGENFILKIVDLSFLIYGKELNINDCDISFKNLQNFESLIQNEEYFFVHFANQFSTRKVINILKKYNKTYFLLQHSRLVTKSCSKRTWTGFMYSLKKIFKYPEMLVNIVYTKLSTSLEVIVYASGDIVCDIEIPSYEYDICHALRKKGIANNSEYHVFLDQSIVGHRDIKQSYRDEIKKPLLYYKRLNLFFDSLERHTGKKVKIALHPRTKDSKKYFEGREAFVNRTAELVMHADIVMGHYSTSLNYPIICKKKLLLLVNNQMEVCDRYTYVEAFSEILDIPMLNIDNEFDMSQLDNYINIKEYDSYMESYIKSKKLGDNVLFGYEYIAKHIDQLIKDKKCVDL